MQKLLYENGKIIGTAGLNYSGPKAWLLTPEDFDWPRVNDYTIVDKALVSPNLFGVLEDMLDDYIEAKAKERGYGSKHVSATSSLVGYANDVEPKFAMEADIFKRWRSAMFARCYQLMAEVQTGQVPMPKGIADIMPFLPVLNWSDHVIPPLVYTTL